MRFFDLIAHAAEYGGHVGWLIDFTALGNLCFTVAMTAVFWTIQLVLLPGLNDLPFRQYSDAARKVAERLIPLLCLAAPFEILAASYAWLHPAHGSVTGLLLGGLVALGLGWIWLLTVSIPRLRKLITSPSKQALEKLSIAMWFVTLIWTARMVLVLYTTHGWAVAPPF